MKNALMTPALSKRRLFFFPRQLNRACFKKQFATPAGWEAKAGAAAFIGSHTTGLSLTRPISKLANGQRAQSNASSSPEGGEEEEEVEVLSGVPSISADAGY